MPRQVGRAVAELWAFVFPQRPLKGIPLALLLCPEISNILDHLPPEQITGVIATPHGAICLGGRAFLRPRTVPRQERKGCRARLGSVLDHDASSSRRHEECKSAPCTRRLRNPVSNQ
jgi:hypothetical protein